MSLEHPMTLSYYDNIIIMQMKDIPQGVSFLRGKGVRMTERQERFCQEFVATGNATQSAISAGYAQSGARQIGNKLLSNNHVQNRIRELQGEIKNQNIADAREMQSILTSIVRGESTEEVIVVEGIGDGCSEAVTKKKKPSQSDRIKAMQLLARMQGVLDNNMTLNVVVPVYGGDQDLED